ncbi:MAG: hypothetical protein OXT67_10380 [Zetaproteobacteria bacterium]|nr:hypothetical protein [Zetaproteobacteria bacterium]
MTTFMQVDHHSAESVVCQYIIDKKGQGLTLPYVDLPYVRKWLKISDFDVDKLILTLEDLLHESSHKGVKSSLLRYPLRVWDKKVCVRLTGVGSR